MPWLLNTPAPHTGTQGSRAQEQTIDLEASGHVIADARAPAGNSLERLPACHFVQRRQNSGVGRQSRVTEPFARHQQHPGVTEHWGEAIAPPVDAGKKETKRKATSTQRKEKGKKGKRIGGRGYTYM